MMSLLSIADLRQAKRNLTPPFRIALDAAPLSHDLKIQTIHRLLPGKRLTARALWRGQTVLVKLFFDHSGYRRHWKREVDGLAALSKAAIPTPRILAQAENRQQRFAMLIIEYLDDAHTLDDLPDNSATYSAAMAATLDMLGRMHRVGLIQRDIHPGNFLWADGKIHVIDGDAVTAHQAPLPATSAQKNLALFLAQFLPGQIDNGLLTHYPTVATIDVDALNQRVNLQRNARWQSYRKKLLRDCTEVRCEQGWSYFFAVRRECDDEYLRSLLADPARYIADAEMLKDGNSSTVALVHLPNRSVVVKRYNIKNRLHCLSRCWRPSRAQRSWLNAHHLRFLGIATPPPLAFFEERVGPLRGVAYYISEYVAGEELTLRLKSEVIEAIMLPVARLLAHLFQAQLLHGDMKAYNVLCHEDQPYLLDLDSMLWFPNRRRFLKAYQIDRKRFLANWPEHSPIRLWFDASLPRVDP